MDLLAHRALAKLVLKDQEVTKDTRYLSQTLSQFLTYFQAKICYTQGFVITPRCSLQVLTQSLLGHTHIS